MSRHVAVFGGFGALGKNLIHNLKKKNFIAISIDLKENSEADHSIVLPSPSVLENHSGELSQQAIEKALHQILKHNSSSMNHTNTGNGNHLEAIINVAGGFVMGDLKETNLLSQVDSMWKVSVQSSMLSAICASKYMREGEGLLVLPGAAGALGNTPMTLAYGLAKSSVHHLVKSLANPEQCGLPKGTTTVGIVPSMLDTEANRQAMPNADYSGWTPLDHVSQQIVDWIECKEKPVSGSLIKIVTESGKTRTEHV